MQGLNKLIQILNQGKIDFVIVGGYSASMHGGSLVTQNLEVCIHFDLPVVEKLRSCLAPYHPKHRMTPKKLSFIDHPSHIEDLKNLYLETDLGVLDIIGFVGGVGDFAQVKENALEINLFGASCFILSIDDLIAAKKFMARPKDLMTVKELECLKKSSNV